MKIISRSEPIKFCKKGSCCPQLSLVNSDTGKWLEITDDFGGVIYIPADKNELIETIDKVFKQ